MKPEEIRATLFACKAERTLCRTYMKYDRCYRCYFLLDMSDRLFLGALEDDFLLDGFCIRRLRDVKKAEAKNDACLEIARKERLLESLEAPSVDIRDWRSVFTSLEPLGHNVIVERERPEDEDSLFAIGRIESVSSLCLYLRHFDADGVWEPEPYKIPYHEITSVTFFSRYVEVFSKYLPPLPENFGKALPIAPRG